MTFILISGKTKTGKTEVCKRLHNLIVQNPAFTSCPCPPPCALKVDLIECFENGGKHIVLNSASDDNKCLKRLAEYLDSLAQHDVHPDIIVTAIRETNDNNCQMSRMLALLEAIADGTQDLESHFTQNIENAELFAPASIGHHAFVLHLEKQGSTNASALGRYWNANASKVYDMLNFAITRL